MATIRHSKGYKAPSARGKPVSETLGWPGSSLREPHGASSVLVAPGRHSTRERMSQESQHRRGAQGAYGAVPSAWHVPNPQRRAGGQQGPCGLHRVGHREALPSVRNRCGSPCNQSLVVGLAARSVPRMAGSGPGREPRVRTTPAVAGPSPPQRPSSCWHLPAALHQ